jgi:lipoprotein-releasing system permease protein
LPIGAYEGVVGWRYLLRVRRRPQVLLIGLGILLLGGLVGFVGYRIQLQNGTQLSVFATQGDLGRTIIGVGGGIAVLGGCLVLFGTLNTFMTAFSAFSAFMVSIGVAVVILVLGVMNGFQADLRSKIIDTHAHVVIEPAKGGDFLSNYREVTEKARHVEGVVGASPYLTSEVMVTSSTNLAPALLTGIDVDTIGQASKVPGFIKHGSLQALVDPSKIEAFDLGPGPDAPPSAAAPASVAPPSAPAPPAEQGDDLAKFGMEFPAPSAGHEQLEGVLVGSELRRNLNLWPGEQLNVVSPPNVGELSPTGPHPKIQPFRLAGWFESGMLEFDTRIVYASMANVQRFMGLGDVAEAVQVRVADLDAAPAVRERLQQALGPGLRVSDWQQRNRNLFSALKLEKVAMFLVLTINILLAAFAITVTLVMTVMERKQEVAILMAMGASPPGIVRIFMSQGAFTGAVGSLIGGTVGLGVGTLLANLQLPMNPDVYYISSIPVDLRATDVVAIIAVAMLVSLVSTLYPALYASRLRPVEGLSAE